ncbi:hypothetical protein OIO90_003658 [Microbotryomycetes sp. JL221]|nr:hypothetical protein OIO90_003658 [Microbotryomycetes sp. JL221]
MLMIASTIPFEAFRINLSTNSTQTGSDDVLKSLGALIESDAKGLPGAQEACVEQIVEHLIKDFRHKTFHTGSFLETMIETLLIHRGSQARSDALELVWYVSTMDELALRLERSKAATSLRPPPEQALAPFTDAMLAALPDDASRRNAERELRWHSHRPAQDVIARLQVMWEDAHPHVNPVAGSNNAFLANKVLWLRRVCRAFINRRGFKYAHIYLDGVSPPAQDDEEQKRLQAAFRLRLFRQLFFVTVQVRFELYQGLCNSVDLDSHWHWYSDTALSLLPQRPYFDETMKQSKHEWELLNSVHVQFRNKQFAGVLIGFWKTYREAYSIEDELDKRQLEYQTHHVELSAFVPEPRFARLVGDADLMRERTSNRASD